MVKDDALDSLKVQFYAVSGVLAFFVIVLLAIVIDLSIKVKKLRKGEDEENEAEQEDTRQRPAPPPINSTFSFSKPSVSKNWQEKDNDAEIRRANDQREFSIPKPALSKSWQAFPGERNRNQPQRNYGNDSRHGHDDDTSNYSYDGRKSPPTFKNSGGAFRNPLSGEYDERQARKPVFVLPPNQGGTDNFGFKREFQRNNNNNNYY